MTNEEIESCIQTLRFLENTFLDDHEIFLNDKHPDNIEKIITFLHESPISKGVTVTYFADRCRECGAEYEKLLEASKPKPGRWKPCGILHKCSKCGMCFGTKTNFCPNCGADMRATIESKEW